MGSYVLRGKVNFVEFPQEFNEGGVSLRESFIVDELDRSFDADIFFVSTKPHSKVQSLAKAMKC